MMNDLLSYKYYDTPEGHDIYKKTFAVSKIAAMTGVIAGTFDVLMYSKPKGFVNTAGRMAYIVGPLVGMAAGYAITTNTMQIIRGKNDGINYFLGGAAAGSIFSAWQRVPVAAVPAMIVLGVLAVLKKQSVDNKWEFFPAPIQSTKTIQSVRHDWTMVKDIEELKNWTTGSN